MDRSTLWKTNNIVCMRISSYTTCDITSRYHPLGKRAPGSSSSIATVSVAVWSKLVVLWFYFVAAPSSVQSVLHPWHVISSGAVRSPSFFPHLSQ